jgi:hypothetical protein
MTHLKTISWTLAVLLTAVSGGAIARVNPTLTETERGIRNGKPEAAAHLRIDEVKLDVHVVGKTADVTLELLIGSDTNTWHEANLALTLPADAVVTGYALDIEGKLIPGQLIEELKAREAFEKEVRRGIDPGLAEVSAGNRFTTRIFPVDVRHPRRIRVNLAVPFDPNKGLVLPLARDAAIASMRFSVKVDGYAAAPLVTFAGQSIALERERGGWRGAKEMQAASLQDGLAITGGAPAGALNVVRHASGESFFVIADTAGDDAAPRTGGRLRIYWDRSASRRGSEAAALESEALVRLAAATRPDVVDLVTYASDAPQVTTVPDAQSLRVALAKITYRGGTSLAGLDDLALPTASHCVMVSDGFVTIDKAAEFAPGCALSILTGSANADGARLARLARSAGGRFVRLDPARPGAAAVELARPGGIAAVRDGNGRRLSFRALPARAGEWLLVGKMPDSGGVTVETSAGAERRYAVPVASAVAADAPGALWAVERVRELGDDPSRHPAMKALARQFQVAGPGLSFLVMERPDQYLRAELEPPAGFSESWMAQYRRARDQQLQTAANDKRNRLARVVGQWQARKVWWERSFVPGSGRQLSVQQARSSLDVRNPPAAQPQRDAPRPARAQTGVAAAPPSSPPPPPPPPPPIIVDETGLGRESIVVTSRRIDHGLQDVPIAATAQSAEFIDSDNIVVTGGASAGSGGGEIIASAQRAINREQSAGRAISLDLGGLLRNRPYLAALDAAPPAERLKVLGEQESAYASVPTFYLDAAEWFRLKGDQPTSMLLLLSALELPASDDETRQIVAFRLERDGAFDRAVELTEQLAAVTAEFRPQPKRALALALAARGRNAGVAGRGDLERAFALLTEVALNPASRDFEGVEVIALTEANALIPAIAAVDGRWTLDERLVDLLDTDARIVAEWTADDADIDLWVDEPNGERVNYEQPLSSAGGHISNDMTEGFGPEEYAIRRAPEGSYRVTVSGYEADRINPNGTGHVLIRMIRNFTRKNQQQDMLDVDLAFQKHETRSVATLSIGSGRGAIPSVAVRERRILIPMSFDASSSWADYTGLDGNGAAMRDGIYNRNDSMHGTNSSAGEWISMDLGRIRRVGSIVMVPASQSAPGGWGASYLDGARLEHSRDGVVWTDAGIVTTRMGSGRKSRGGDGRKVEMSIDSRTRYIRVIMERSNWLGLGDFYALEP